MFEKVETARLILRKPERGDAAESGLIFLKADLYSTICTRTRVTSDF
jgi:hypothetical protein